MQIYLQQNRAILDFPYNPRIINYLKSSSIKARFDSGSKKWWLPAHETAKIELIQGKFCKENPVMTAPENVGEIPPMPELDADTKALLQRELLRQCYHYQEQGVAYALKHKCVINGDDMGGGKTQQSIATVVAAGLKGKCGLVICKGSLKYTWEREFMAVAGMKSIIMADSIKTTWYQYYTMMGITVFITNYESLEKYFVQSVNKIDNKGLSVDNINWRMHPTLNKPMKDLFDYIILDESHEIRNEDTLKSVICVGMGVGKEYRLALSGTAIVNKSKDIYAQLNFLGKTKNTKESRKAFMDRYCGGNGAKSTNMKELHYNLSRHCYFRRNRNEFGIELPDLTMQLMYSEITNRREYDHCVSNLADYLKQVKGKTDGQVEKSMNAEIMVQIQHMLNISARGKLRDSIEAIDEVLESGRKVVVGINQKEIKEALKKHYPDALIISGEENAEEKNKAEIAFRDMAGAGIIIVSIKAGGVGINLQTASDIICVELPWHPAIFNQFIARVHRNGQKNKVNAKVMIGKNTFDERVWEIIESKKDIADTILGGDDSDVQREIIDKVKDLFNSKNIAA